jgi:uncharacterized protein YecE (DUF72 family)
MATGAEFSGVEMPQYFVGTSGYHYRHWREVFYPHALPARAWLPFYSERFRSVEINGSFYRLPSESTFETWREQTPSGFVFAVKGSRLITHYRRLRDVDEALGLFLQRASILKEKLGPILFQLPGSMARDDERLDDFLRRLIPSFRYALEFRHPSWLRDEVYTMLERYGVALCAVDAPQFSVPLAVTAPFVYIRFHGPSGMYAGKYSPDALRFWSECLRSFGSRVREVYAYFNNDERGFAAENARELLQQLS